MTRIVVFGASGASTTGAEFVRLALAAGHHVTCLSIEDTINEDTDAVVVALGTTATLAFTDGVCSVATALIVDAMKRKCPSARLQAVSSLGAGNSTKDLNSFVAFIIWFMLWRVLVDKNTQEQTIFMQTAWLDWSILRPAGLTNGPAKGVYKAAQFSTGGSISRKDVAGFLLENLTESKYKHQAVVLNY
ncbi:hypothetical protein HDU98_008074 [Podochytrium sp. JEL0797]|nr:hypothetical protein HDU98_008074 [Podochytrium sp. JEL0797]